MAVVFEKCVFLTKIEIFEILANFVMVNFENILHYIAFDVIEREIM